MSQGAWETNKQMEQIGKNGCKYGLEGGVRGGEMAVPLT